MQQLVDLSGKKIIVAGASSGIGKAIALLCAELGAKVILIARRENLLAEVINEMNGEGHSYYSFDLSQTDRIESLVKQIVTASGSVDGMVYAAGIAVNAPLLQTKPQKVQDTYTINVYGFIEFVRQLSKRGNFNPDMSIVGISSAASLIGDKGKSIYSSTKAAMNAAMKVMAHELGDKGIRVNTVAPGMTATRMFDSYLSRVSTDSKEERRVFERQYLGLINAEDVANVVAFLLSSAAKYVTGVVLPVDGGMTSC